MKHSISEAFVFGPDAGFNTCKAVGARVTGMSAQDIPQIRHLLVETEFPSYWSPTITHAGAMGRIMESPEEGIVGIDAKELQPSLWTTSLGEDHYNSAVWRLYFWAMLYDALDASDVPDGAHVRVFTALGLPHIHMGYADMLRQSLVTEEPHILSRRHQKTWTVTVDTSLQVQTQPFWIVIDQVFQWRDAGLIPNPDLLQGGLVVLDFGSKTLNGIRMVNNLIPVDHISVSLGTWDVVKAFVAPEIETMRQKRGITVGDIRWQALMDVYETGQLTIGKHAPLNILDKLAEYNREKVAQRIKEVDAKLDGGANTRTILLAGGDAGANYAGFESKYAANISGEFRMTEDDDGSVETKYRQMHGICKGAIRAWAESVA